MKMMKNYYSSKFYLSYVVLIGQLLVDWSCYTNHDNAWVWSECSYRL